MPWPVMNTCPDVGTVVAGLRYVGLQLQRTMLDPFANDAR